MIDSIIAFFDWVQEIWNTGIYDFVTDAVAWLFIKLTTLYIKMKILLVGFAWDVAVDILEQLDISGQIDSALDLVSSESRAALAFFRVPEAINILLSGYVTRFVLRFLPLA